MGPDMRTLTTNTLAMLLFALAMGFLSAVAQAAPVTADLSWTAPDAREDGTALDPSEIAEYRIYHAIDDDIDPGSDPIIVTGGNTEVVTIDLVPRAEPYDLVFAVTAVDTEGRESDLSNVAIVTALVQSTAAPAPPTSLRLEIRCDGECSVTVVE